MSAFAFLCYFWKRSFETFNVDQVLGRGARLIRTHCPILPQAQCRSGFGGRIHQETARL
jgi:hypothetical protein